MKRFKYAFLPVLAVICLAPAGVPAQDNAIQTCTTNEQCTLVTKSCSDNCAFVPVSSANLPAIQASYQQRCGKAMTDNPQCVMNPPLGAACINGRCTIDYAYANHAGAKDYENGQKGKVTATKGTAYDLQGGAAVQPTLAAPAGATGTVPPAAIPTGKSMATPPTAVPAQGAPAAQPQTAAPIAPQPVPNQPMAQPTAPQAPRAALTPGTQDAGTQYEGTATVPNAVPKMRPTREGEPAPTAPGINNGKPVEYVPQQVAPAPDQTTRAAVKTGVQPSNFGPKGTVIPADGTPTAKPQAPSGSVPIPPSDLKPAPTFVPPTGTAIPVSPEDPGAPPPPGSSLIMNDGKLGVSSDKSFTQKQDLRSGYTTNQ